jgi:hypothetical protein
MRGSASITGAAFRAQLHQPEDGAVEVLQHQLAPIEFVLDDTEYRTPVTLRKVALTVMPAREQAC